MVDLMDFGVHSSLLFSASRAGTGTRASFYMKFELTESSELDYWS